MIKLKNLFALPLALASIFSFGQTSAVQRYPNAYTESSYAKEIKLDAKENLEVALNRLAQDPVLRNASWGFAILDPSSKKLITSHNAYQTFMPASTTKLLTTEAAMSYLGPNFRFITQLEHSGKIDDNGTLNGDLYIVGSGDPTVGVYDTGASAYRDIVSDFTRKLENLGIRKITGDIVVQTAIFKENKLELPRNIVWLEHNNYYLPVGNTHRIDPRNERFVVPQKNIFDQTRRYFYISPYVNQIVYSENFKPNEIYTELPQAPAYLGNLLKTSLIKSNIPVSGTVYSKTKDAEPVEREPVAVYRSPVLEDIVYFVNQTSNNKMADEIMKTVGFMRDGDLTLEAGRKTVVNHLKAKGYDFDGLILTDGSGLNKGNFVTPISQVMFLSGLMTEPFFNSYLKSLPIAGQSGTLKKTYNYSMLYGNLHAKTGTLNRVKTLAGYIKTRSGKMLPFSLLINNYSGSVDQVKSRMEQILQPALDL